MQQYPELGHKTCLMSRFRTLRRLSVTIENCRDQFPRRLVNAIYIERQDVAWLIDAYLELSCELVEYLRESGSCMTTHYQLMIPSYVGTVRHRYRFLRLCKPEEKNKVRETGETELGAILEKSDCRIFLVNSRIPQESPGIE